MICTNFGNSQGLCVSRARHRGAIELRAKNHLTLFQCALNTENVRRKAKEENKGFAVFLKRCPTISPKAGVNSVSLQLYKSYNMSTPVGGNNR